MKRTWRIAMGTLLISAVCRAQEAAEVVAEVAPEIPGRLTLMDMMQEGGVILYAILGLAFIAVLLTLYLMMTVTSGREVPKNFLKRAHSQVRGGDLRGAFQMCQKQDCLIARVLAAGLKMAGHDRYVIQEAMESEGERGATALWQRISYLNNIATISPLLGLLGTVWGMMNAFGAISMDNAQVKSLSMASSIATAMVTTAAGLVVAIPAMIIFFYLRGRVIKIVAEVEAQASEFVEMITRSHTD